MEPDSSIDSASIIRVVVLQVGDISASAFRSFSSLVTKHRLIPLKAVAPYYKEHQKSPFTNQPWEKGILQFKYILGGASRSPWEDFQAQRRIHGVIGLCHASRCSEMAAAHDEFLAASKGYPAAQARRCFMFDATAAQRQYQSERQLRDLVVLPRRRKRGVFAAAGDVLAAAAAAAERGEEEDMDAAAAAAEGGADDGEEEGDGDEEAESAVMLRVMHEFAAGILMALESWVLHADPVGAVMTTPLDAAMPPAANEDPAKAKKRRLARIQKAMGDFCLLAASPTDAHSHYVTAVELSRVGNDLLWLAGALEGSISATAAEKGQWDMQLEDEVRTRYTEIIQLYRKASAPIFELEAAMKVARFICRKQMAKEVVDLLAAAVETGRTLQNPSDRLVLYLEVGRIFGQLGYERKAAFFAREVAQLYEQQESRYAAISALQVLSVTAATYKVESRAALLLNAPPPSEGAGGGRVARVPSDSQVRSGRGRKSGPVTKEELAWYQVGPPGQWSTLQMEVLNDMLSMAVRAGDALAAWSAAARLLRGFYPLIPQPAQLMVAAALDSAAQRLPAGTRCADPCLPYVRFQSFAGALSQTQIVKRMRVGGRGVGGKNWWGEAGGGTGMGPFIYTPFRTTTSDKPQEIVWVAGELAQVVVEVANPSGCELTISSIFLSVSGAPFDPFPVTVTMAPHTPPQPLVLSGMPRAPGRIAIHGCFVCCFGVTTEHKFDRGGQPAGQMLYGMAMNANPFVRSTLSSGQPQRMPPLPPLVASVLPELPLLIPDLPDGGGAPVLFEGEARDVVVRLLNSGSVAVTDASVAVDGRLRHNVAGVDQEALAAALPLAPGGSVDLVVHIVAQYQAEVKVEDSNGTAMSGGGKGTSGGAVSGPGGASGAPGAVKDEASIMLVVHYAGPLTDDQMGAESGSDANADANLPPGRSLTVPLHLHVQRGLQVVRSRLIVAGGSNDCRASAGTADPAAAAATAGDGGGLSFGSALPLRLGGEGARQGLGVGGGGGGGIGGGGGGSGGRLEDEVEVPVRQAKGQHLLDLQLWNGTDVGFDISVMLLPEEAAVLARRAARGDKFATWLTEAEVAAAADAAAAAAVGAAAGETGRGSRGRKGEGSRWEETPVCRMRVDQSSSSRLLVPLDGFCLHREAEAALAILRDEAATGNDAIRRQMALGLGPIASPFEAIVSSLCARIKVKWASGRNSWGELPIREALKKVVESPSISVLLPDPLSFSFRVSGSTPTPVPWGGASALPSALEGMLLENREGSGRSGAVGEDAQVASQTVQVASGAAAAAAAAAVVVGGAVVAQEFTEAVLSVRNESSEVLAVSLSIACRDMMGVSCMGVAAGARASIMWEGTLAGIEAVLEPGEEFLHKFSICFLIPGDYSFMAAAIIDVVPSSPAPPPAAASSPRSQNPAALAMAAAQSLLQTMCFTSLPHPIVVLGSPHH